METKSGTMTQSDEETATTLNDFFVSVFSTDNIDPLPNLIRQAQIVNTLEHIHISEDTVQNLLQTMKTNSSPGPDQLHPKILYEIKNEIRCPLTLIFRKSLDAAKLPTDWKNAVVVPIYKSGKKKLATNYTPVSLTSVIGKLLEKVVRDFILEHLKTNNIISDAQFGFVPGRSCNLQLLDVMEAWTAALDAGIPVDVVYTDFSKAFDTVSHRMLLHKLETLGIKGKLLEWITNFLRGRKQCVRVKISMSEWKPVTSGVPQGSVLGPVLFLCYINDLPEKICDSNIRLFADDAKLSKEIQNQTDSSELQEDINRMCTWTQEWSLQTNATKCKVMHVGKKNNDYEYSMTTAEGNMILKTAKKEKDLGVTVDENLTFSEHIGKIVKKAYRNLGLVKRSFKYMGKKYLFNYTNHSSDHM